MRLGADPRQQGGALVFVLLVLMLLGGLVAAVFVPAVEEMRAGTSSLRLAQAAAAAEGGIEDIVAHWPEALYDTLDEGDSTVVRAAALASRSGWYAGTVYRLGGGLFYLVRVQGFSRDSMARQSVGRILESTAFDPRFRAVLTAQVAPIVTPGMVVSGSDSVPPGWIDCPRVSAGVPSTGNAWSSDPDAVPDTMLRAAFEIVQAQALSKLPRIDLAPGTYPLIAPSQKGLRCFRGDSRNWGEPHALGAPCARYFPLVYVSGDLTVTGGAGQGVLIVRGNLVLDGGFEFFGPVFVGGSLTINQGTVFGGVLVADTQVSPLLYAGSLIHSSCALTMGSTAMAEVAPLAQRSWIMLP